MDLASSDKRNDALVYEPACGIDVFWSLPSHSRHIHERSSMPVHVLLQEGDSRTTTNFTGCPLDGVVREGGTDEYGYPATRVVLCAKNNMGTHNDNLQLPASTENTPTSLRTALYVYHHYMAT